MQRLQPKEGDALVQECCHLVKRADLKKDLPLSYTLDVCASWSAPLGRSDSSAARTALLLSLSACER